MSRGPQGVEIAPFPRRKKNNEPFPDQTHHEVGHNLLQHSARFPPGCVLRYT